MMWQSFRSADSKARTEVLDMPRAPLWGPFGWLEQHSPLVLYGYSPAVLPAPKANPTTARTSVTIISISVTPRTRQGRMVSRV